MRRPRIDFDARTETQVGEPWVPEGVKPIEIGDDVVIRISNECICPTCLESAHPSEIHGRIENGVVIGIDMGKVIKGVCLHNAVVGHYYHVESTDRANRGFVAAIELTPIDEAAGRSVLDEQND